MMELEIGFIGAGNMAGAIIESIVKNDRTPPAQIGIYDVNDVKIAEYKEKGHPVFDSAMALTAACKIIVLAVKPQNFTGTPPDIAKGMTPEKVLVSIMTGITAEAIKEVVGFDCKLVLVMPNTPVLVGEGASALARVEPTTKEEFAQVMEIFAQGGAAYEISPSQMREIIPVNGSSPAFIYRLARNISDNAVRYGIDYDTAMSLFCQTLIGSAKMLATAGKTPQELIDMVCSRGGTTLAAMQAMDENGFDEAVTAAFDECVKRAKELSGQ